MSYCQAEFWGNVKLSHQIERNNEDSYRFIRCSPFCEYVSGGFAMIEPIPVLNSGKHLFHRSQGLVHLFMDVNHEMTYANIVEWRPPRVISLRRVFKSVKVEPVHYAGKWATEVPINIFEFRLRSSTNPGNLSQTWRRVWPAIHSPKPKVINCLFLQECQYQCDLMV